MKFFKYFLAFVVSFGLFSCDNEIDLNTDFTETTVVFGLINASDTVQNIRITKTFLEDGASAIDLAQDPIRIYYDSLNVSLIRVDSNHTIELERRNLPKDPGVFTTTGNQVYFTNEKIIIGKEYTLQVKKPDGSITQSTATVLGNVSLVKPPVSGLDRKRKVNFVNTRGNIIDYEFEYNISKDIAKFEAYLYFQYKETIGGVKTPKEVKFFIGSYSNSNLEQLRNIELNFTGNKFFQTIADNVTPNANNKEISNGDNLIIEIVAVDSDFKFYQDLNGPIDGLAQVRPEFTNIKNGVGLFASRSKVKYNAYIGDETKGVLVDKNGAFKGYNFIFQQ